MKNIIFISILFFSIMGKAQENSFTIVGKTNINTFKCINKNFDTPNAFGYINNSKITINVADFNCKSEYITKDFRKTLNADKYPQIQVNFGKFKKNTNGSYSALTEVKLMNKVKTYTTDFTENGKTITAKQSVKFSDFGIIPPKKMGGMIVVKDELDLYFSLDKD
jgi:polyisoprenoid-binding protein YceI